MNFAIPDSVFWLLTFICIVCVVVSAWAVIDFNKHSTDQKRGAAGVLHVVTDEEEGAHYLFLELADDLKTLKNDQKITFTVKTRSQ